MLSQVDGPISLLLGFSLSFPSTLGLVGLLLINLHGHHGAVQNGSLAMNKLSGIKIHFFQ